MAIFQKKTKVKPVAKEKAEASKAPKNRKKAVVEASKVLLQPHITEKATAMTAVDTYIFKVAPSASKGEIRDAVEQVYGVNVKSVNVIKKSSRTVKKGKYTGTEKGYKKGIVKIAAGQKIELLPH